MNNQEVIEELYKLFAAGNNEAVRKLFDPNIEWIQMTGFPNGGRYIGADAIFKNVFSGFHKHWQNWKAEVKNYLDAGDTIIAIGYYEGTFLSTGKFMHADFAHLYTLRNGKITRFVQYTDTLNVAQAMKITK